MSRMRLLSIALTIGCSAPEIADLPPNVTPPPNSRTPDSRPRPTPSLSPAELAGRTVPAHKTAAQPEANASPPKPPSPPKELVSTPEGDLSAPPFTAWTTHAPLTPVGPGGKAMAHIARYGVRIDVVQVLDHRTRFRCTGCSGDAESVEAWVQSGRLRAAGIGGTPEDPLVVALQIRARWAGGRDLPEGATPGQMCALVDAGFVWESPDRAVWESDGGRFVLTWSGGRWSIESASAPRTSTNCRTDRARAT